MESEYIKSNRLNGPYTSLHDVGFNSRRRLMSGAFPKRSIHSPREEKRLQTSCSLPETPIFARGLVFCTNFTNIFFKFPLCLGVMFQEHRIDAPLNNHRSVVVEQHQGPLVPTHPIHVLVSNRTHQKGPLFFL